MEENRDTEEIVNSVADILDGTLLVLGDVNAERSPDMRLHVCIAALKGAREQLEAVLEGF